MRWQRCMPVTQQAHLQPATSSRSGPGWRGAAGRAGAHWARCSRQTYRRWLHAATARVGTRLGESEGAAEGRASKGSLWHGRSAVHVGRQLEDGAEDEAPPAPNYPALLHGAAAPQWRKLAPTSPSGSLLLITPTPPVVQCGAACRRAVVPTSGPRYLLLSTESGAVCAARVQQQVAMSGCAPAARPCPGWGLARPWAAEHNKWVITTGPWTSRDGQGTPGGASAACYAVFQCPWLHTSAQPSTHQRTTASQVQGHPPPGR